MELVVEVAAVRTKIIVEVPASFGSTVRPTIIFGNIRPDRVADLNPLDFPTQGLVIDNDPMVGLAVAGRSRVPAASSEVAGSKPPAV